MGAFTGKLFRIIVALWVVGATVALTVAYVGTQHQASDIRHLKTSMASLASSAQRVTASPQDVASVEEDLVALRAELRAWERQTGQPATTSDAVTSAYVNNQLAKIQSQLDGLSSKLDFTYKQTLVNCGAMERAGMFGPGNGCGTYYP